MFKLTATKSLDGIKSTITETFRSWKAADAANHAYQDAGWTVLLVKSR